MCFSRPYCTATQREYIGICDLINMADIEAVESLVAVQASMQACQSSPKNVKSPPSSTNKILLFFVQL